MDKLEELLGELQAETAKMLLKLIKSGEAQPQHFTAAIKMLKDNGITVEAKPGDPGEVLENALEVMGETLPFPVRVK